MFDIGEKNNLIIEIRNGGNNIAKKSLIKLLEMLITEKRISNDDAATLETLMKNQGQIRAFKQLLDIINPNT